MKPKPVTLILSQSLDPAGSADLVQLVPLGRFVYADQAITGGRPVVWEITRADVAAMIAAKDSTDLVVDYEHQTLTGGEAPAAGWITELVDGGDRGLLGRVRWTDKAAAMVQAGEYRYVSPVVLRNIPSKADPDATLRAFLHSVALTNRPYHPEIEALAAKAGEFGPVVTAAPLPPEADTMKELQQFLAKLVAEMKLSIEGDPTAEAVLAATQKAVTDAQAAGTAALAEVREALGLSTDAAASEISGTIAALKQGHGQVEILSSEVAKLKQDLAASKATDAVAAAMKAGKVTPAQKEWAEGYAKKDLAGFEAFVAKAAVVIDTSAIVDPTPPPGADAKLGEATMAVAKMFGNSEEDLKKYGQS